MNKEFQGVSIPATITLRYDPCDIVLKVSAKDTVRLFFAENFHRALEKAKANMPAIISAEILGFAGDLFI